MARRNHMLLLIIAAFTFIYVAGCTPDCNGEETKTTPKAEEVIKNIIGQKFKRIKPGKFLMGSTEKQIDEMINLTKKKQTVTKEQEDVLRWVMGTETPQHEVKISKTFYMQTTEVTQAQWKAVMGNNPSYFKGENLPVENVSWIDVQEFISKLNVKEETEKYRLPTEAEWEYACRAGSNGKWFFGDNESMLEDYVWFGFNSSDSTRAVGKKKPNSWGLYDMHGNVWEWCQDWYKIDYYKASPGKNPQGPSSGKKRVARGGSAFNHKYHCRSAFRSGFEPDKQYPGTIGFRLCFTSEN